MPTDVPPPPGWLERAVPIRGWLGRYRRDDLTGDLNAGLTVAIMLVPQAMAYAMLAGLPPIMGLYASVAPLAIYALFGTSRQLAVGPVAIVSLLVAAGITPMATPGSPEYITLAIVLAGLSGLIMLIMGIARMGFLMNFISHPVISGFTSAAALIIGFSQLKHLLGINLPRTHHLHRILGEASTRLDEVNLPTLAIGLTGIVLLYGLKRWKATFPGALVVVGLGTASVWAFDLHHHGVAIVGDVPGGLPAPVLPFVAWGTLVDLLPAALTISLVGYMESIAVARSFASQNGYAVDANQELIGLGGANLAAMAFSGYPVTGGFSRTAVNGQAGARTPLASLITAAVIALTLLFLTRFFFYMPKAVLAAVIMVAVFALVDVREVRYLWRVKRSDLALLAVAFVATLLIGIEEGILISVVTSLVVVIKRTTAPHTAILGRLPETRIYRNIERYADAETFPGLAILRIDANLYFANIAFVKERIAALTRERGPELKAILLDCRSISDVDSSADTALRELAIELRDAGVALYLANVKGPVRDLFRRSGLYDLLGADHFFFSNNDAVCHFLGTSGAELPHEGPHGRVPSGSRE